MYSQYENYKSQRLFREVVYTDTVVYRRDSVSGVMILSHAEIKNAENCLKQISNEIAGENSEIIFVGVFYPINNNINVYLNVVID